MAAAKKQDIWNAMEEWDKIWLEQQDWLDEQEIAFQSRIDDLRAQIQKKYDARLKQNGLFNLFCRCKLSCLVENPKEGV